MLLCAAQAPQKAAPAKAAPAKPASGAEMADPQNPDSLIALLAAMDAKAETSRRDGDSVNLRVTTANLGFGVQFAGCDEHGRKCRAMAFSTVFGSARTPTLAQTNGFNQTSLTCRAWQDAAAKPNVMYTALISPRATPEDMRNHIGAWQGCLATFAEFLADPVRYLASAP